MIRVPTPEEFDRFLEQNPNVGDLVPAALGDIARLIEIAHLVETGTLGASAVLAGGMAMRLRGSSRLTRTDADLSATPAADVDEEDLLDALELDLRDTISIIPERVIRDNDIIKAFPVRYSFPKPPAALGRRQRMFKVELSVRGLELPPEDLPLVHDYDFELGLEDVQVPTMALAEAVAEKAVAYALHLLPKHFADMAFAIDNFKPELIAEAEALHQITQIKFSRNKARFRRMFDSKKLTDYGSMKHRFTDDFYLRQVKPLWTSNVAYVGQASQHYTFQEALKLVTNDLVPLLFP